MNPQTQCERIEAPLAVASPGPWAEEEEADARIAALSSAALRVLAVNHIEELVALVHDYYSLGAISSPTSLFRRLAELGKRTEAFLAAIANEALRAAQGGEG